MATIKWVPSGGFFSNMCAIAFAQGVLSNCQKAHKKAIDSIYLRNVEQKMRQGALGETLGLPWGLRGEWEGFGGGGWALEGGMEARFCKRVALQNHCACYMNG